MNLPNNSSLQYGKYRITRFISSGGFGCTYEAVNTYNSQRVAIKELFVKDVSDRNEQTMTINAYSTNKSALLAKIKKKFIEEANALKSMNHPNIVKVYDSFEENGTAYYVMDYIDGQSLLELVNRNGALPGKQALKYITQIADALSYVHSLNRLHLDIKPGNIMIDRYDNAILIDFGVSKQYDEVNGENTSTVIGKSPEYSPLEQLGNNIQQFSPATDIYALGATLYKCVTGKTPPHATTILSDGFPQINAPISENLKNAIKRAMEPVKRKRIQNIAEFKKALKNMDSRLTKSALMQFLVIVFLIGVSLFLLWGSSNLSESIHAIWHEICDYELERDYKSIEELSKRYHYEIETWEKNPNHSGNALDYINWRIQECQEHIDYNRNYLSRLSIINLLVLGLLSVISFVKVYRNKKWSFLILGITSGICAIESFALPAVDSAVIESSSFYTLLAMLIASILFIITWSKDQ